MKKTKIRCPFCSFSVIYYVENSHNLNVLRCADKLRYHLQYECAIHNIKYVEDYL